VWCGQSAVGGGGVHEMPVRPRAARFAGDPRPHCAVLIPNLNDHLQPFGLLHTRLKLGVENPLALVTVMSAMLTDDAGPSVRPSACPSNGGVIVFPVSY